MDYTLNYSVQGFYPLKIEMTQFPDGFGLNLTCTERREFLSPIKN